NYRTVPYNPARQLPLHSSTALKSSAPKTAEQDELRVEDVSRSENPLSPLHWEQTNRQEIGSRQQDLPEPVTDWIGGFGILRKQRVKRAIRVVNKDRYNMITEDSSRTPWGQAARILKNIVRRVKGKKDIKSSVCIALYN
ncbi:unnamed protein product, partial [Gongylonema pulchrum]|uniref:Polyprotein n=1 Tax=Gongylonema pulchrum TaxID=637853 RepID=A0A183CXP6_9BILA